MFEPILTDYLVNEKTPSQIFWLFDAFNQSKNLFDAYSLTFKITFDPKARFFGLFGKNWSIFGHFWAQNKILGHFSKFWQIFVQIQIFIEILRKRLVLDMSISFGQMQNKNKKLFMQRHIQAVFWNGCTYTASRKLMPACRVSPASSKTENILKKQNIDPMLTVPIVCPKSRDSVISHRPLYSPKYIQW